MADRPLDTTDYRTRRGEVSAYGRAFSSAIKLRVILCVFGLLLVSALLVLAWWAQPFTNAGVGMLFGVVSVLAISGLWFIYRYMKQHFIEPDLAFRMWLQQVCDGNLDARIGLHAGHKHHKELNFHTRNLASSLSRLSDDMDGLVESQTRKLNDQKQVLELLFKLTTDVASDADGNHACHSVCAYLADWFNADEVCCFRVIDSNEHLSCVTEHKRATGDSVQSYSLSSKQIRVTDLPHDVTEMSVPEVAGYAEFWVPFFAGDSLAGVLIILFNRSVDSPGNEYRRVLTTASEQLSLLCSKQLIQEQTLNARLNRDRNELAAEIHDSLAQTLLATRYQLTLLSEKLRTSDDLDSYTASVKIQASIEEANEEVRGLIRENRIPLAEHRYVDSLQKVIDQFSQSSELPVFFQTDDPGIRFTPREEATLQRIIIESLNNARKYANASMVRVYVSQTPSGVRSVLIEDDGNGFELDIESDAEVSKRDATGEQLGLTIMRERAMSVGANLIIDTEPGEGTRVTITLPPVLDSTGISS